MPTLEEQIERIADAAVEQSSSETPPGPGAVQTVRRERSRWWLGAAAAVLLLALVGALAAMAISRADPHDEAASHDLFAQPSYTLPVNEPTVDFDTTETWLLPTWLPDAAEFDVATSSPDLGRQVQYRSPEWSEPLEVWTDTPMIQTLEGDEVVAIDGARWLIDETVQSDGTELRRLSPVQDRQTELSGVGTIVSGTLSRDSLAEVAASLERRSATGLERPALPIELGLNDGVVVARGMRNSVSEQLRVDTASTSPWASMATVDYQFVSTPTTSSPSAQPVLETATAAPPRSCSGSFTPTSPPSRWNSPTDRP